MNDFENNSAWGYYPEDLQFDEKTQTYKNVKKNEKNEQNLQKNMQKSAQNNFFSQNFLSKMFENNDMLSALLKGGTLNGAQKNDFIMQALSNMGQPKKQKKETRITPDNHDFFEEL